MDLISSNSGNTFNKAINNYYNIYTEYKNDSILVNFGDSNSKVYQLNSGIKFKLIKNKINKINNKSNLSSYPAI